MGKNVQNLKTFLKRAGDCLQLSRIDPECMELKKRKRRKTFRKADYKEPKDKMYLLNQNLKLFSSQVKKNLDILITSRNCVLKLCNLYDS